MFLVLPVLLRVGNCVDDNAAISEIVLVVGLKALSLVVI